MIRELKSFIYYFYDRVFFINKKIKFKKNNVNFEFIAKDKTSLNWYSDYNRLASSEIDLINYFAAIKN